MTTNRTEMSRYSDKRPGRCCSSSLLGPQTTNSNSPTVRITLSCRQIADNSCSACIYCRSGDWFYRVQKSAQSVAANKILRLFHSVVIIVVVVITAHLLYTYYCMNIRNKLIGIISSSAMADRPGDACSAILRVWVTLKRPSSYVQHSTFDIEHSKNNSHKRSK